MNFVKRLMSLVTRITLLAFLSCGLLAESKQKDWSLSTSLSNSVGLGTFVAGHANNPAWSTSISISPSYQFKSFWGLPRINLSASQTIGFWWLENRHTSATDFENRVSFSDLNITASMSGILRAEEAGVSLGASLGTLFPTSLLSRRINRVMAFELNLPLRWSKWGFSAGWTPGVSSWIYSNPNISAPCFHVLPGAFNPNDINADVEQILQGLAISRNVGNGRCLVAGRQTVASLSNMFSAGWANDNHSVSFGFGWFLSFLRPLAERPETRGEWASGQNFTEALLGRIAYSYTVPLEVPVIITSGVSTYQASYSKSGKLNFPFFDFVTPGNNQTQFFVQATVRI